MSKTAQRKQTFFLQGYQDFLKDRPFRWAQHTFLDQYRAGWLKAQQDLAEVLPVEPKKPWWKRLLAKVGFDV